MVSSNEDNRFSVESWFPERIPFSLLASWYYSFSTLVKQYKSAKGAGVYLTLAEVTG